MHIESFEEPVLISHFYFWVLVLFLLFEKSSHCVALLDLELLSQHPKC